jgi:hypothetical protein
MKVANSTLRAGFVSRMIYNMEIGVITAPITTAAPVQFWRQSWFRWVMAACVVVVLAGVAVKVGTWLKNKRMQKRRQMGRAELEKQLALSSPADDMWR